MLFKYVWLIGVEEISFIRSCDMEVIKATDCIIKVAIIRGNIMWCSFALRAWASKWKAHDNLCFPLRRAYLLIFGTYFYARVNSMHSHFNLKYSLVWKHNVVGKYLGTYDQSNIFDHDLLLLTIISMINELGGETLSPYLSLCLMDAICSKNMLWVLAIMEYYMMIEYVELLLRLCWISWIAIAWWLRT